MQCSASITNSRQCLGWTAAPSSCAPTAPRAFILPAGSIIADSAAASCAMIAPAFCSWRWQVKKTYILIIYIVAISSFPCSATGQLVHHTRRAAAADAAPRGSRHSSLSTLPVAAGHSPGHARESHLQATARQGV